MDKQSIKFVKSLSERKARAEHNLFVVEGVKLIEEVVKSGLKIESIFFTEKFDFSQIPPFSPQKSEKISPSEMERISSLKSAPSALAVVKIGENYSEIIDENSLILALDSVQDPGNLGTIIRICDWFGIRTILCSKDTVDLYNQKVVQSTMGAIFRVKVIYCDLVEKLEEAQKRQIPIFVTDLGGENIYTKKLHKNGIIVMGNEGKGVSERVKYLATDRLLIPSYPADNMCESLNVAVATAIICAEFRRGVD
ncbi:MAG: RNA methyltransferase [Rikenellaceae bacterium]